MTTLNTYLMQVQRLIGYDEHQTMFNPDDLIDFVNIARSEVAAQGQCIRNMTPASGQVIGISIVNGGSGYTAPIISITPPDLPDGDQAFPLGAQATAIAQQVSGVLSDVGVAFGGSGYFAPGVSVIDSTGTGAVLKAVTNPINTTNVGQEIYYFNSIDLTGMAGVGSILAVLSVSLVWGNWQWSAQKVGLAKYMAQIRQFTTNYLAPPTYIAQQGQGVAGSIRMYPIPDQPYPMLWNCLFLPSNLVTNLDTEAIPAPWTNAVPYYAAHLALLSKSAIAPQLLPLANTYFNEKTGGLFGTMMRRARAFSEPGGVSSFYGRV